MTNKIRGRNEGSIYQRTSGKWRAQISTNGKRRSKSFTKKDDALSWLSKMRNEIDGGLDIDGNNLTVREYVQMWLNSAKSSLQESTSYQYELTVRNHIIPNIGHIRLKDLRLITIEGFYGQLLESGIGVRTVRYVHAVLHKALEKAVNYGYIIRNPAHGANLPKYTHAEMNVLDATQVTQFLIAARGSKYEALYYLAIHTGMRQGELFGLQWSDLQWNSGNLHVQRQVRRVPKHGWKFGNPKTKAGRRTIKLGEGTLNILRQHRELQKILKKFAGDRWQENDLIFPSSTGTPGDPSNLRKDFLMVLEKTGVQKIRFHDLRHTAASLMLNNGVPPIVVSKILGHAKPSTTLDVYGHLYTEMQTEAAMVMDKLVTPIQVDMNQFAVKEEIRRENS